MQPGVDEVLGLVAGQIQTRAAQAVTRTWRILRSLHMSRGHTYLINHTSSADGCFNPCGNNKRQRALVIHYDSGVLDAEFGQHLPSLRAYGVAIVWLHAGGQLQFYSPGMARLEQDVTVRTDIRAGASGFGNVSGGGTCHKTLSAADQHGFTLIGTRTS
jgi:hypothetical protein